MTRKLRLASISRWPVPAGRMATSPALSRTLRPLTPPNSSVAVPRRHAHHFMNLGMVVNEVIDSVAPGPVPAIRLEQRVDHHGRLEPAARNLHRTAIDDHRKARVVRNDAVIGEYQGQWLARAQHLAQPRRIGPILDKLFGVVLNLVLERHNLFVGPAAFQRPEGRKSFRRLNLPSRSLSQDRKRQSLTTILFLARALDRPAFFGAR